MKENKVITKVVVIVFIAAMVLSAIGTIPLVGVVNEEGEFLSKDNMDKNSIKPQKSGTRAGSPRTVLAELFTNWGCGYCPTAGKAMNELMDAYGSSQLVMIAYHIGSPSATDPFYNYNKDDSNTRKNYYALNSVPQLYVDGPPQRYAEGKDPIATYIKYKTFINPELTVSSPMTITLEGYINQVSLTGFINATIEITDTLPIGTLNTRIAVVEDNNYVNSPNGETRHRYVMRDMLPDELLPSLITGQSYEVSRTFPIDPNLNMDSISVVVFVQNDDDKDVLQAASYDYIPQDILIVDDDDSVNPLGYEDDYHDLLCQMEYAFDGWVLNDRGNPSSQDLANYEAVIWVTADTSSSTLTTSDQTAISDYLDNERGSVFITGENVGSDIGLTAFYQNYLHSTFIMDDVGQSDISGISSDPISDPFSESIIPISDSSPSEISPINPASLVFTYSPSDDPGGIKAVHDYDSKVVYFDFMYFEGTDSDSNKMILMERILNWMRDLTFSIQLSEGWNLISIPLIQPDTSISTVLESINGDYDSIQWFDPSDKLDHWKHSKVGKPFGNDLSDITHEFTFWVHITKPGGTELSCKGTVPIVGQSIDLHTGWNLVGYPSLINRDRDTALNNIIYDSDVDAIWTYDATIDQWKKLESSDNFELGNGYWIHSIVEKTWDVPL